MSTIPRRHVIALLAAVALAVAGCGGFGGFGGFGGSDNGTTRIGSEPYAIGSGKVVTEARNLATFHALHVEPGIAVIVTTGGQPTASITLDDNLISMIKTTVADGTLTITVDGGLETHHSPKVTVTAQQLDALAAASGSTIDWESVAGSSLTVTVATGSTVRAGGKTVALTVDARSGSTADLRNLTAEGATVHAGSGSTVHVNATHAVTGECTGGSTTIVHGHPATVTVSSDTSSTVKSE